jgi:hypothetical protein
MAPQGRSRSYQPRPCKGCCFLSTKSRDANKDTNTQSGRTLPVFEQIAAAANKYDVKVPVSSPESK